VKRSEKADLRGKTADELTKMATELRESLFKGRFASASEGKGLGGKARGIRRQIARIETLLSEARRAAPAAKPAVKVQTPAAAAKAPAATKASAKSKVKA
jgi:ribosomal protein L29